MSRQLNEEELNEVNGGLTSAEAMVSNKASVVKKALASNKESTLNEALESNKAATLNEMLTSKIIKSFKKI